MNIKIIGDKIYYEMEHVANLNPMNISVQSDKFKFFLLKAQDKIAELNREIEKLEKQLEAFND
jgi:hypothetical protein